jgi:hypothetical protein
MQKMGNADDIIGNTMPTICDKPTKDSRDVIPVCVYVIIKVQGSEETIFCKLIDETVC